jgi:hypothetical protein
MKPWLVLLTILAVALGAIALRETSRGQVPTGNAPPNKVPVELGPDEQGATLRQPGLDTPPMAPQTAPQNPAMPNQIAPAKLPDPMRHWNNNPAALPQEPRTWDAQSNPFAPKSRPMPQRIVEPPSNRNDINKDFEVTEKAGAWLILVMSYSGPNAPVQANKFVLELRNNPLYKNKIKGSAYVFNFGAEEKRKEYERVAAEREKQRRALIEAGCTHVMPIPVRVTKIDESTGVLIGGFPSRDAALSAVKQMRGWQAPDPKVVDLQIQYIGNYEEDKASGHPVAKINIFKQKDKNNKEVENIGYVNPFKTAFPVRNPLIKESLPDRMPAAEVEMLRKLNAGSPFSLFQCKKPLTLAIKQYNMAMQLLDTSTPPKGFMDRFLWKQPERKDYAAMNAHTVAEAFRKAGFPETYVLNARHCSYVTIGGFDSLDEPNMRATQTYLEQRFTMPDMRALDFMPRPVPMIVPQ